MDRLPVVAGRAAPISRGNFQTSDRGCSVRSGDGGAIGPATPAQVTQRDTELGNGAGVERRSCAGSAERRNPGRAVSQLLRTPPPDGRSVVDRPRVPGLVPVASHDHDELGTLQSRVARPVIEGLDGDS